MRAAFVVVLALGCSSKEPPKPPGRLQVSSPAFAAGAAIPAEYTCEGADRSPPLAWSGAPAATQSYALVVDDRDAATKQTWVHWVVTGIPATVTGAGAGTPPAGGAIGKNDFGTTAWGGPCPPIGRHRYVFHVYALATRIATAGITKRELVAAMQGHVLAEGELVGTYQKQRP